MLLKLIPLNPVRLEAGGATSGGARLSVVIPKPEPSKEPEKSVETKANSPSADTRTSGWPIPRSTEEMVLLREPVIGS